MSKFRSFKGRFEKSFGGVKMREKGRGVTRQMWFDSLGSVTTKTKLERRSAEIEMGWSVRCPSENGRLVG